MKRSFPSTARRFLADEHGGLSLLTLGILPAMLMAGGMAVDYMNLEASRVRLQATLDRAVVAAASLNQTQDPETVVRSYFEKAGLGEQLASIDVQEALNFRQVSATASLEVDTFFLRLLGMDQLSAAAAGSAIESHSSVEISLVLDVSGSMNDNQRLPRLKTAASNFVDSVLAANREVAEVSISIIPFSTQVAAGPDILSHFNRQYSHEMSHCIDFPIDAFRATSIDLSRTYVQTGYFDPFTNSANPIQLPVCPSAQSRHILYHSADATALKGRIGAFWAGGNTSIDVGVKWGAWLLDPSSRPVVTAGVAAGLVNPEFEGRPLTDNDETNVMKVLIVMSDGANTAQYALRPEYATGLSTVWRDPDTGRTSGRYRDGSTYKWTYPHESSWNRDNKTKPYDNDGYPTNGVGDPVQLTWQQVWKDYSIRWHKDNHRESGDPDTTIGATQKDTRTHDICQAAKDAGMVVFTIGFEAGDQGDATLRDCASSDAHFFDVEGLEIEEAFRAISSTINRLRLSA